jgi:hypothetical protein
MDQLQTIEKQKRPAEDTVKRPPYVRREEILYDGKRYRLYTNYLTMGAGFLSSSIRNNAQKMVGADYQFHIKRQYFQAGVAMSGTEFLSNNNVEVHVGYGLRRERNMTNLAAFIGPTLFTGVQGTPGVSDPSIYNGWGGYVCLQAVSKFVSYDIGLGGELFAEVSEKQTLLGFKIIVFFSGAYRGVKRNFNPNVRAENPGLK